jgi:Domain of unknown function (DUF222)
VSAFVAIRRYNSNMHSSCREDVVKRFDAYRDAVSGLLELTFDVLTTPECLAMLEFLETEARRLPVPGHALINQLRRQAGETELGGKLVHALANRLRISRGEAARRIHDADDLGPRQAVTGEPLPPRLAATAKAQRDGTLGAGHVAVIRGFVHRLPDFVDVDTRHTAEGQLARLGGEHRPDELAKLADKLTDCLNPDGNFTDEDRARRRGCTIGKQGLDGMSPITGFLTPESRATLDAVFAKLAAPGMCNPADPTPCIDGTPSQDAIQGDTRSGAQRSHDALNAALQAVLASGKLGQHNGLPASIIVTTTLQELESGCGTALTAGGSLLPMSDVIRMAGNARNYLAIFDKGRPLALYHRRRLASPAQRIMLYAMDRGCTHPGCDVPGYLTEVHHVTPWATTKETDIHNLTLGCGPHHKLAERGWITRKRVNGDTEWVPPPHLDRGQTRVNTFHHPEKLLRDDGDGGLP